MKANLNSYLSISIVSFMTLCTLAACSKSNPQVKQQDAADEKALVVHAPSAPELLKAGDSAPNFEAKAHNGTPLSLTTLKGKFVIVYFYPRDGTPGCTAEAKGFAKQSSNLESAGAVVIGVSSDDAESHREFADEYGLPFYLVADTERTVAQAYGVGSFLGMTSRVTFLIDPKGIIAKVYPDVSPKDHAQELLKDIHSKLGTCIEPSAGRPEAPN